ncbi:DoxX family protein, partial [Burkholderia contaminans]
MNPNRLNDFAATLLRVALGVLYLAHVAQKVFVFTLPGTAQFFASIGLPGWLAYLTTFVELAGGL